ncbi:MAG: hypothetical protein H3C34_04170 [Caldilineaceae bacterium]|nr:hypothetical protein [Caldilineaceae bacterium]
MAFTMSRGRIAMSVGALAAAILLLEGVLLRLLAIAQFYHFAFLVVSLALLGFGASGTLLSVSPRLRATPIERLLAWVGALFSVSVGLTYVAVNYLPFDSYSIAWDRRQLFYFVLYYLALTVPFLIGGLGIGAALAARELQSHRVYAANLAGSAVGALLAPVTLAAAGVPGALVACAAIALLPLWQARLRAPVAILLGLAGLVFGGLWLLNVQGTAPLGITISPYKGLAHALRYPGSERRFGGWSAIARVDVVANAGTRQLPGLSYAYRGTLPVQLGVAVDAGDLQPVTLTEPEQFEAAAYMPEAIAFALRPGARILVLEPAAGLGVLQALAGDAAEVTAVVDNRLERLAVTRVAGAQDVYAGPHVRVQFETARVFTQRDNEQYGIVFLPLTGAYQPVTSGAYSLAESYNLTVEAFVDNLDRLAPGGILVTTRWLQTPPSEEIRLVATLVEALKRTGIREPAERLVALRGIQTITALVQKDGWTRAELDVIRTFAAERRLDLVWAPGIEASEVNRFNRLPEPVYYETVRRLFAASQPAGFFETYPFDVAPATDDHPFFFHFFKWAQTPEVLATLGRTWQPFGGSGYFLLLAMLALVLFLSLVLIMAPLLLPKRAHLPDQPARPAPRGRVLLYFGLLGLAFLFVEIPLIQRWILLVGHPTYAFAAVVVTLLLFSSLGSLAARSAWLPARAALALLVALAVLTPFVLTWMTQISLGWAAPARIAAAALCLAPLAFLMGMPFPLGLAWIERAYSSLTPWVWAVNGCASVISGVLAAILALSYGFTLVQLVGAGCYGAAWLTMYVWARDV